MVAATMENRRIMTDIETAEMLGIRKQTLALWRCQGKGPAFVKVGRWARYFLSDVERWLDSQRVQTGQR